LNTVRDPEAVDALKHDNGYLVSLSSFKSQPACASRLTVRRMTSPQDIDAGISVALNCCCFGMDFNDKYIVVPTDSCQTDDSFAVKLFSFDTLEVVRILRGFNPRTWGPWLLLRNLIISEWHDNGIRQFQF
jgi:hypothetical protein